MFGEEQEGAQLSTKVKEVSVVHPSVVVQIKGGSRDDKKGSSDLVIAIIDEVVVLPRSGVELVNGSQ